MIHTVNEKFMPRKRLTAFATVAALSAALAACGGGGGGGGGAEVPPEGAVSLVDGRVGDSPYYDDGSANGLADGRYPAGARDSAPAVSIHWNPVEDQLDAQPEFQLAGYRVYYGHKPGNYDYVIEVADPLAESYTVSNLPRGTFYFATTAVDALNQEGPLSGASAVTVN